MAKEAKKRGVGGAAGEAHKERGRRSNSTEGCGAHQERSTEQISSENVELSTTGTEEPCVRAKGERLIRDKGVIYRLWRTGP